MAITVEVRAELIKLVVGMFNAAPGFTIMTDLANASNAGQSVAQIAASLEQSTEFKSIYPVFLTNNEFVTKLVNTMVGNLVSAEQKAWAVTELTAELNAGASRSAVIVSAVTALSAVPADEANWGAASTAFANKVDVATYFTIDQQQSGASLAALQAVIASVDNTAASVTTAKASIDGTANPPPAGQTFTLTTGIDNFVGGAGDDTFNAVVTATSAVLGALDSIDGGAGNDTLNVTDTAVAAGAQFSLPVGLTVKNVENMQITTNGGINVTTTGFAGLTKLSTLAAGTANTSVTAAATTDVNTTVTGAATTTIAGGKAVNVTADTGTVSVTGTGLTSVSVTKGGGATISSDTSTTAGAGTTLKSVSLTSVDANSTIAGRGLESVTLAGTTTAARTVTITNSATTDHSLTINANVTGYTAAFDNLTTFTTVVQNTAKSVTINASGAANNVQLTAAAATALNLTGSGALRLENAAGLTNVKTIDGSAATGNLTLGTLNVAATTVKTGSGNDSFTLGAAKVVVEAGAGNDTVTLTGAIAAGSTINLGAGDDKLLNNGGSVATSTLSATTVIDGGDGFDTVSASLINAGNAKQFINFEALDLSAASSLDVELMTGSTIQALTLSGGAGGATSNNVAKGVGLTVTGNNAGTTTINVKDAGLASSTSDSLAVTFAGTTGAVNAGTVVANKVEGFTIASNGTTGTNSITLTSDTMKTVTITGSKAATVSFAGANGTVAPGTGVASGVTNIDGSAATGVLTINTTNVTAAAAGLTVSTGSGADVLTINQKATVNAGAGNDTITITAGGAGSTVTGGAGNDTIVVKDAVYSVSELVTTITDFTVGADKLTLKDQGTEVFNATKVDISAATNLTEALNIAAAGDGSTHAIINWFQYGADTYIVQDLTAGATIAATDIVVKLTGLIDLSTLAVADFNFAA